MVVSSPFSRRGAETTFRQSMCVPSLQAPVVARESEGGVSLSAVNHNVNEFFDAVSIGGEMGR